ncbi:ABC transporter substrate-binding protein [uncultured Amnibacterium sp.]|uniref:ABC transporter substrate-binding protein n=1 Tax=uncultured Amnibacterium sp. TaxID=1631851 RepID=UPI0035CB08E6
MRLGGTGLGVAGLASLAACAPAGSGSDGGTLKMLYFGDQKSATALQQRLQPAVTKLDKKSKLVVTGINGTDWNDFIAKVLTQIAAGSPPDIISVATEGLQLMASKDLAIPLDDYVKRDMKTLKGDYFDDVHPSLIESMMYQGHLYELTGDFNAGNMYYSTDLFEKAGLDAPAADWTLDDFEAAATKIAKVSGNVNAFDWVVRLWGSWTSFMYANEANLVEEGKYSGGDWLWSSAYAGDPAAQGRSGGWKWGQPTANAAGTVEALDYMIELKKKMLAPSPDVGGGQTLQGLFSSGRIGMAIGGGFWAGGLYNAGMKNGSFDVQLFPKWKSQRHLFGNGGYGILNSSKQKDLAWEVLKLLVAPSSFDIISPGNVTTPARKSLMTAERYAETGPKNWDIFYKTLTDHPDTAPIPAPPYYNAMATALNRRTTQAMSSGSAKSALDGLQADLEAAAKSV